MKKLLESYSKIRDYLIQDSFILQILKFINEFG